MTQDPDYILELGGRRVNPSSGEETDAQGRPYVSVLFECCSVYNRVYKNRQGTAYVGWCPKCMRKMRVAVGSGGTSSRFFRAR